MRCDAQLTQHAIVIVRRDRVGLAGHRLLGSAAKPHHRLALNMKTVQNFRPPDGQNWQVAVSQLALMSLYRPWLEDIVGQGLHCCSRDDVVSWA